MAGFLFRLETVDGAPAELPTLEAAVPNWKAGDSIYFGYKTLRVVGTRVEDGKGLVDAELWAENQLGEVTASGHCTIELPRRTT